MTKAQNHWLVIERSAPAPPTLLRLDKREFRAVIAALNARTGKRVEVLDPGSSLIDPTVESHDEDETIGAPLDRVVPALKGAMESFGCRVSKGKDNRVECHRRLSNSGRTGMGGEMVVATLSPNGEHTRIQIRTTKGIGRNWSSPILRATRKQLQP